MKLSSFEVLEISFKLCSVFLWATIVLHHVPPCFCRIRLPTKLSSLYFYPSQVAILKVVQKRTIRCLYIALLFKKSILLLNTFVAVSGEDVFFFLSFYYNCFLHDCQQKVALFLTMRGKAERVCTS